MKKCLYSIFIIFSLFIIYSCTPLMNDLEKLYEDETELENPDDVTSEKIASINIIGKPQTDGILFAQVLDKDGNSVGGALTYQWQYFDEETQEWKNIDGAVSPTFECIEEYVGKKVKVIVFQGENSIASDEVTINSDLKITNTKIKSVNVIGYAKIGGTLFAQVLDENNESVGGKLEYQWQYFDEISGEWINIGDATTSTFECSEMFLNKKVKVVVKQDENTISSNEVTISSDSIPINDSEINEINILGSPKYNEILFATPIDDKGNLVDGKISYKWEYFDNSQSKWIEIPSENFSFIRITDKSIVGKKIRVTTTKNSKSVISNEVTVQKATLTPSVFEIEIPIITENEVFSKDCVKVTLKDKYGNDVVIKDIVHSGWPYTVDESFNASIKIITDEYEDITKQEYIRVKWRDVEDDEVPEFAVGYENMPDGKLKFKELTDYTNYYHMEYSYDGGTTWTQSLDEFTPTSRYILLRWKGDNYNETTGRYSIYPSTPYELAYRTAKFKVVNFTLDQADLELTFDEATGTLTMEEGFLEYIWFVKSGCYSAQDTLMIEGGYDLGTSDPNYPNKFNLTEFFEEMPEDRLKGIREDPYDPWPEFGRPGKYYIQGVAINADEINFKMIPYSATCWVELK